jgi:hypothetical protein
VSVLFQKELRLVDGRLVMPGRGVGTFCDHGLRSEKSLKVFAQAFP